MTGSSSKRPRRILQVPVTLTSLTQRVVKVVVTKTFVTAVTVIGLGVIVLIGFELVEL